MPTQPPPGETGASRRGFNYGWVLVAAYTLMMAIAYGIIFATIIVAVALGLSFWLRSRNRGTAGMTAPGPNSGIAKGRA